MTATAAQTTLVTDPTSTGHDVDHGPVTVDFDTRLILAAIGMDVMLAHSTSKLDVLLSQQGLEEAHAAVTAAIAEADRYGAEAAALAAVTAVPGTFTSNRILRYAGDLIRQRGWHQNAFTNERGAVCALAAIRIAAGGNGSAEADAVAVLLERIRHDIGRNAWSVPGWNDSRRNVGDVLMLLY
jgi:hypothetical protein